MTTSYQTVFINKAVVFLIRLGCFAYRVYLRLRATLFPLPAALSVNIQMIRISGFARCAGFRGLSFPPPSLFQLHALIFPP